MKHAPVTRLVELVKQSPLPRPVRRGLANAYGSLRTVLTLGDLAHRCRRKGRPIEIWVGDSHAMWCNTTATVARVSRAPSGAYVWHLGPRLMWSVARDGFPRSVTRFFRALGFFARAEVVPVFVLGEIDVRCHLVGRDSDMRFVASYVDRIEGLVRGLRRPFAVLVVPPPPSFSAPLSDLPVRGDLDERLAAFQSLRDALGRATARRATPMLLLDVTDQLLGENGLRPEFTDDRVHTNGEGAVVLRQRLVSLLEEVG